MITVALGLLVTASASIAPLVSAPRAIVSVLLLVFGAFLLRGVLTTLRTAWLVKTTPTEDVRSLAVGRTEVKGIARPADASLPQPFTDGSAVIGEYRIRKHDPDPDGKQSGWVTTDRGTIAAPFTIDDGTGEVRVDASEDADVYVSDTNTTSVTVPAHEPEPQPVREFLAEYTDRDVDPDGEGSIYDRKHRYVQEVIPPDEEVYVFGDAEPRGEDSATNAERLVIDEDDDTGRFVISDKDEPELVTGLRRRAPVLFVLGLVLSIVGFRLALIELGIG